MDRDRLYTETKKYEVKWVNSHNKLMICKFKNIDHVGFLIRRLAEENIPYSMKEKKDE
jgi:ribosomal 30S subunit maturation factor RimM